MFTSQKFYTGSHWFSDVLLTGLHRIQQCYKVSKKVQKLKNSLKNVFLTVEGFSTFETFSRRTLEMLKRIVCV